MDEQDLPSGELDYYVDEDGNYYYQTAVEGQALLMNNSEGAEAAAECLDTILTNEDIIVVEVQEDQSEAEDEANDDVFEEEEGDEQVAEGKPKPAQKHMRQYYNCKLSAKTGKRRYVLLRHTKTHSEDRPYKCDLCKRGFKAKVTLKNHINMHFSNKPYVCEYCRKAFTTSGELIRHVRYKHTHEKPHKCTECDYACVELSKLRRHFRCHTGKTFKGGNCRTTQRDLKMHMLKHSNKKTFICDLCSQSFRQKQLLRRHLNLHHDSNYVPKPAKEMTHSCPECQRVFVRKGNLIRHLKIGHQRKVRFVEEESMRMREGEEDRSFVAEPMSTELEEEIRNFFGLDSEEEGEDRSFVVEDSTVTSTSIKLANVARCFRFDMSVEDEDRSFVAKPMSIELEEEIGNFFGLDSEEEGEDRSFVVEDSTVTSTSIKLANVARCFRFDNEQEDPEDENHTDEVALV